MICTRIPAYRYLVLSKKYSFDGGVQNTEVVEFPLPP